MEHYRLIDYLSDDRFRSTCYVLVVAESFLNAEIKKVDKRINRNHLTSIAFEAVIFHQFGNVPYIYKTSHVKFFLKMGYSRKNPHSPDGWGRFLTPPLTWIS